MVLSKREKYILIGTIAAGAIFLLIEFVYSPLSDQLNDISNQRLTASSNLSTVNTLFARQSKLAKVWAEMKTSGLQADASAAEHQLTGAILDWEKPSGAIISGLKPERSTVENRFQIISFHVTATGSMPQIARLISLAETSSIPLRVNDIQVTPRKEGTDDLSVQLSVSTLCMLPETEKPAAAVASAPENGGRS